MVQERQRLIRENVQEYLDAFRKLTQREAQPDKGNRQKFRRFFPPNTPGAFVHVGKTGGSTLSKIMKYACHAFVPKPCQKDTLMMQNGNSSSSVSTNSIISETTTYFHTPDFDKLDRKKYDFYVFSLRDPLERIMSAFYFEHPRNRLIENRGLRRQFRPVFEPCFPNLDALGKALDRFEQRSGQKLGARHHATTAAGDNYYYRAATEQSVNNTDCPSLAAALFDNKVRRSGHFYHDLNYMADRVNITDETTTILSVRQEYLWEDWVTANAWLSPASLQQENSVSSHNKSSFGNDPLPVDIFPHLQLRNFGHRRLPVTKKASNRTKSLLCRALTREYHVYLEILQRSVNLSPQDRNRSVQLAIRNCPELSLG